MRFRQLGIVLAVVAVAMTAGCLGGGDAPATTTPTPTTSDVPTTTAPTTTTPEPTTTATPTPTTTTTEASAAWQTDVRVPETVHDGELSVQVTVTNVGDAAGTWAGELRTYRAGYPERYNHHRNLSTTLNPGESATFGVTVEPTATDDWPVFLDGERVGSVAVDGLGISYDTGGSTEPARPNPILNGSVTGDSRVGAMTGL